LFNLRILSFLSATTLAVKFLPADMTTDIPYCPERIFKVREIGNS
jgi:hypothetical protein